jgi:hypothetical protein
MVAKDYTALKSMSRGIEGERRLLVVHTSNSSWDATALSAAEEKKARVLLAALREHGKTCSVDEAKEMIASKTLSGEPQIHDTTENSLRMRCCIVIENLLVRLCSSQVNVLPCD